MDAQGEVKHGYVNSELQKTISKWSKAVMVSIEYLVKSFPSKLARTTSFRMIKVLLLSQEK